MMNVQMIVTALEKYNSYMYYAYNSDSLRPQDAKNLCEFLETALQSLIFTDSENEKVYKQAQDINKLLNEALTYALRLNYILCRARTYEQGKIVYNLIGKIADITFIPDFYTCEHDYNYKILSDRTAVSVCSKCKKQVRA